MSQRLEAQTSVRLLIWSRWKGDVSGAPLFGTFPSEFSSDANLANTFGRRQFLDRDHYGVDFFGAPELGSSVFAAVALVISATTSSTTPQGEIGRLTFPMPRYCYGATMSMPPPPMTMS
ncbi:MAG: hypothetical protein ACI92S_000002 [Planctomycetaceae bacterium]|jgi:hypothetical protein